MSGLDYAALAVYAAVVLAIGVRYARKSDQRDFYLAGGRIPWWAAGLSVFGTQLSAITFMAIPAKAYAEDWTFIVGQLGILLCAPLVVARYLPLLRSHGVTTVYEYLEIRFDLAARLIGAALFTLLQLGRMGIVIFLPAIALATVTGLDLPAAILLTGLLTTLYSATGGIEAVIWTDVIQVVVLLGGAVLAFAIILGGVPGGPAQALDVALAADKLRIAEWSWSLSVASVWVILLGQFFTQLTSYSADQTVVQRYLTTPDLAQARKSIWLNAVLSVPASLLFFGLGTALYAFYALAPERLDGLPGTDAVFPFFIVNELPPGVVGLLVAGIFSAAMSTLDSSINSVSAVLVNDFYVRLRRQRDPRRLLRLARLLTVALGLLATGTALVFASFEIKSLFDAFLEVIGLAGGSLGGLLALAVFAKRVTAPAALVGVCAGIASAVFAKLSGEVHFLLFGATGFVACVVTALAASLVLRPQATSTA